MPSGHHHGGAIIDVPCVKGGVERAKTRLKSQNLLRFLHEREEITDVRLIKGLSQFSTDELARVVAQIPFECDVLFLARTPTAARRQAFLGLDFEAPQPVLRGKTIFFVHPARLPGKRSPFNFEEALGMGTARSARVVRQILGRMSDEES